MPAAEQSHRSDWFEEEVLALLPDLYTGARHLAEGQSQAEDLVAEAVARAWERRRDLRDQEKFRGWLFQILRRCFLSRKRKESARPTPVPLLEEESGEEPAFSLFDRLHAPFLLWQADPEKEFLDGILREDLEAAVESLPQPFRMVVVLADVQGFSYAEIAETMEIPIGTVRSRLARGRSKLQEALWCHAVDAGLRDSEGQSDEQADAKSGDAS